MSQEACLENDKKDYGSHFQAHSKPLQSSKKESSMHMIMFVLDDPEKMIDILTAWEKVGITGVTILESTGMHRVTRKAFPMRYLPAFYGNEESHQTLMAIVRDESVITACLEITESIVGDLNDPHTGILTAWPLSVIKGGSFTTGN